METSVLEFMRGGAVPCWSMYAGRGFGQLLAGPAAKQTPDSQAVFTIAYAAITDMLSFAFQIHPCLRLSEFGYKGLSPCNDAVGARGQFSGAAEHAFEG